MFAKKTRKEIEKALGGIQKQFGADAVMRLGEHRQVDVPCFSSGSLSIDHALGTGGYPLGRLIEIFGPESSGKTTVALHAIAQVQRSGGTCAFIDAEHALDTAYARALGVCVEDLILSQPDHGEQALGIAHALLGSGVVQLVVVDSVAALVPKSELEGQIGDIQVGGQARMMAQAMRMITGEAHRRNATVLFINQTRQKIGVSFGNPETTTGGNALKFFASVRLDVRRIGHIKGNGDAPVGARMRIKVIKNKLAPPFRVAECDLFFGKGICRYHELVEHGETAGLVTRTGTWYAFGDVKLGQGRDNAAGFLERHADVADRLEAAIRSSWESAPGAQVSA